MLEVGVSLKVFRLCRFHQTIASRTGPGTVLGIGEQPSSATHGVGPDYILCQRITDIQLAVLAIA